jgi:hypothetical protein
VSATSIAVAPEAHLMVKPPCRSRGSQEDPEVTSAEPSICDPRGLAEPPTRGVQASRYGAPDLSVFGVTTTSAAGGEQSGEASDLGRIVIA